MKGERFGVFSAFMMCSVFSFLMFSHTQSENIDLISLALAQIIIVPIAAAGIALLSAAYSTEHSPIIKAVYGVCVFYAAGVSLVRFSLFLGTFTHLSVRLAAYIAALLLLCLFAAKRGFAAILRCSALFFLLSLPLELFGTGALVSRFSANNIHITVSSSVFSAFGFCSNQLLILPALFILMKSEGMDAKKLKPAFAVGLLFSAVSAVLSLGVLGGYERFAAFPFYTAAQSVGAGAAGRLDAVFLCVRCVGVFLALSLLFCALRSVGSRLPLPCACVLGLLVFASLVGRFGTILLDVRISFIVMLISVFILPMMIIIPKRKLAALIVAVSMMTGCEKVQLENRLIIKGVGIDGKSGEYVVTAQYIDNYSDGSKQSVVSAAVCGESVSQALGSLKDATGGEPFFGQLSAVVVGKEAARGDIKETLGYFAGYSESRPTVSLYFAQDSAADILTFEQNGEIVPIDHLTKISPSADGDDFTLMGYYRTLSDGNRTPTAASLMIKDGCVRLAGVAYRNGGDISLLCGDDYLAFCLLRGLDSESVIKCGGVSCEVTKCKTRVTPKRGEKLIFSVKTDVYISILESRDNIGGNETQRQFEPLLESIIKESAEKRLLGEQCDIYGFCDSVDIPPDEYRSLLKNAVIDVDVSCTVTQAKALR